jgi:hypothetical protein
MQSMETQDGRFVTRAPDPFGDSAKTRLARMGVTNETGEVSETVMKTFAEIFSGLFFDDVRDRTDDPRETQKLCECLESLTESGDSRRAYLFLSLWYDRMRKPLPDPVWWLAGNPEAVGAFMKRFVPRLGRLAKRSRGAPGEERGR